MVGICGVIGGSDYGTEPLGVELANDDERQTTYREQNVAVQVSSHPQFHAAQPATAADGSLVWVYGTAYGFEGADGYEPRNTLSTSDAAYCAELYDEHGMDFVAGLNGEFAGLVFDQSNDGIHLFTDRLGSRPLFYTRASGAVLFSSRLQSIGLYPSVTPTFDQEYLAEFFGVQKAFGTATVLSDVRNVAPASILPVDTDGTVRERRTYWRPEYRPVDRSPDELAAAVGNTFSRVFADRLRNDLEYGVMLSGGCDSRLVLGCVREFGVSPQAFHLTNWPSRETRTAERVARTADVDLRLLRRDGDYHADLLDRVPRFTNFVGAFDESIASGFVDELGDVDVLLTGYLGDTMFGTYPLYVRDWPLSFPPLYRFERRIESVSDYVNLYLNRYDTPAAVPDFLDAPALRKVLSKHLESGAAGVRHHGVNYPGLQELQLCEYHPLTNQYASANADSLRRIAGHWSPFFDNRLIDLHLTIPVRDRLRYDPINLALRERAPELAAIPHAWTGVPPDESVRYGPKLLARKAVERVKQAVAGDSPPKSFLDHGPWMDEGELIREHDFIERSIERNADLIEALPFLDRGGIDRCYREHVDGADNWRALYALVTLLESPVATRVGDRHR